MDLAEREAVSGRISEALRILVSARQVYDPSNRVLHARYAELSDLMMGQLRSRTGARTANCIQKEKFTSNIARKAKL